MSVDPEVLSEFPELRLWVSGELEVPDLGRRSPAAVRERLHDLSDGFRGADAVLMRSKPIPQAYRIFLRQLGVDPDKDRPPVEAIALERIKHGRFRSYGLLHDALTIAIMETSVPLWALDAPSVSGSLSIRAGDDGRLVVADAAGPVAVLLGDVSPEHVATRASRRVVVFSVQVAGVPSIHLDEALWIVRDILSGDPA